MKNSWSFSSLCDYEKCPHTQSFPYEKGERVNTEAQQAGIDAHKKCEDYMLHPDVYPVPYEGFPFEHFSALSPFAETKFGLTDTWELCDYKEAWFKMIPDYVAMTKTNEDLTAVIIDYKNGGRQYNEVKHAQQMQLYSCALKAVIPRIAQVETQLWYLPTGLQVVANYPAKRLDSIRLRFHNRALKMMNDKKLAPNPTKSNCKFCNHKDRCAYVFQEL